MTKVLIEFINDIIDETTEEYQLILGKTKEETDSVQESYKYIFAGISVFIALIITIMGAFIINIVTGGFTLFLIFIVSILILLKRQCRLRKLNDAYGLYISTLGQKKDHFLKIRKEVHYYEYLTAPFPSNVVRNSLIALEVIDHAYSLYNIGIYEKLFPLLTLETKQIMFRALLIYIKNSAYTAKELQRAGSKELPFFIHSEINKIIDDNKKYIPEYFMEPLTTSNYEIYVDYNDHLNFTYGGMFRFIKTHGYAVFANYNINIKQCEFLLDENFSVIKYRLKNNKRSKFFQPIIKNLLKINIISTRWQHQITEFVSYVISYNVDSFGSFVLHYAKSALKFLYFLHL